MAKHTTNTHRESPLPLSFSLGWTQFSGWLSFICCHRAHTSIVSSSSVFRGRFSPLPALCEMGLIAGIWCKKNGYIYGHVFEPEPEPVPGQCCHWQNRTEQDIPLQVISRICYARVAACDNNKYNCNYINCNITEWASEHVRERVRERDMWEMAVLYTVGQTERQRNVCVGFSVSCSRSGSGGLSSLGSSAYSWLLHTTNWILCKGFALCPPSNALFSNHHPAQLLALSFSSPVSRLPLSLSLFVAATSMARSMSE